MAAPGSLRGHPSRRTGACHDGDHRIWCALHLGSAAPWRARQDGGMNRLTIQRPDDWHVHLRDTEALKAVAPFTAERFGRAIVMPNLKAAITTTALAGAYRQRIVAALPAGRRFEPLMPLYLTNDTSADEIDRAKNSGFI